MRISRRLTAPGLALLLGLSVGIAGAAEAAPAGAPRFADDFDTVDPRVWKPEYTTPTARAGRAIFRLKAGVPPDRDDSWSKIVFRPQRFTSGRFKVRFALSARPRQAVWWGAALWDDGKDGRFNEINFGYTTDQSFTNRQFLFESARRGVAKSVKIDAGVDLYDGKFHEAVLEYDRDHVALTFDGQLVGKITDRTFIPTDPMEFIVGPRLVTDSAPLTTDFLQTVDCVEISDAPRPVASPAP